MTSIYITTSRETGSIVAEVENEKLQELTDCIMELGYGFGDTIEVDYDMNDPHNDVWGLIDAIYEMAA